VGPVTIRFTLATASRATVKIVDVAGRLVRTLGSEELAAGPHDLVWDGKAEGGAAVRPGVYFYRLEAAGWSSQRRVVVLQP
jgi:flagellar hook assembly protein FlgD